MTPDYDSVRLEIIKSLIGNGHLGVGEPVTDGFVKTVNDLTLLASGLLPEDQAEWEQRVSVARAQRHLAATPPRKTIDKAAPRRRLKV
jgi:hypothetical protein